MGLVGLIVAMLINLSLQSSALQLAISAIGVLLFAGLTAYDTQRIKGLYDQVAETDMFGKVVIMGRSPSISTSSTCSSSCFGSWAIAASAGGGPPRSLPGPRRACAGSRDGMASASAARSLAPAPADSCSVRVGSNDPWRLERQRPAQDRA